MPTDPVSDDGRTRTLADGQRVPLLALGVWQVPNGTECVNAVRWALELGYRHIDTAQAYGNEESVGRALRESGLEREEVFITTKFQPNRRDPAAEAKQSLTPPRRRPRRPVPRPLASRRSHLGLAGHGTGEGSWATPVRSGSPTSTWANCRLCWPRRPARQW